MRIALSHLNFAAFAGTETYVFTVARQLGRLGHDAFVYTANAGEMADYARSHGISVLDSPSALPDTCDAVIAQDAATAYELAARYPEAVRVFVMHSRFLLQSPPQIPNVCQAVVVMNDRLRRRAQELVQMEIVRLRQPVDVQRFGGLGTARQATRPRVLTLTAYRDGPHHRMIEAACALAGCELARVGADGPTRPDPERAIGGADVVVSTGRGAIEAMAAARGVYVLGPIGGDGWVTPASYAAMESDGFSGRASSSCVDADRLAADLSAWEPATASTNRDLAWSHHDAESHAIDLLELIGRLTATTPAAPAPLDELARLVRMEWYEFCRAQNAVLLSQQLRAERDRVEAEAAARIAELERERNAVAARLEHILGMRRVQLAAEIARPFDAIRRRLRRDGGENA